MTSLYLTYLQKALSPKADNWGLGLQEFGWGWVVQNSVHSKVNRLYPIIPTTLESRSFMGTSVLTWLNSSKILYAIHSKNLPSN